MEMENAVAKKTLDYTVDFPELSAPAATSTAPVSTAGVWGPSAQPSIKSSVITEAFKLSAEERASRGFGKAFGGNASEEQQKCNQIANQTGLIFERYKAIQNGEIWFTRDQDRT